LALVDTQAIAARGFMVVLDSVNGAGGRIGVKLLEALGCDIIPVNIEPTGLFAHEPEPTAQNLTGLCDIVREHQAAIGFAQDPDADRLAIVDEAGTYIGEEYTLALAAKYVLDRQGGTTAANLSTSRMIDDVAQAAGAKVIRTPVGEANVAHAMIEHGCVVGGEGNGGIIDLRVGPIRDSLVAMALVLQLLATEEQTVGELAGRIGGYAMLKQKFSASGEQAEKIMVQAQAQFSDAQVNTEDGCRLDLDDGWIHLRVSNTEPVMRMIIEAQDQSAAQHYADVVLKIRDAVLAG
jgi:phosphomannomutase